MASVDRTNWSDWWNNDQARQRRLASYARVFKHELGLLLAWLAWVFVSSSALERERVETSLVSGHDDANLRTLRRKLVMLANVGLRRHATDRVQDTPWECDAELRQQLDTLGLFTGGRPELGQALENLIADRAALQRDVLAFADEFVPSLDLVELQKRLGSEWNESLEPAAAALATLASGRGQTRDPIHDALAWPILQAQDPHEVAERQRRCMALCEFLGYDVHISVTARSRGLVPEGVDLDLQGHDECRAWVYEIADWRLLWIAEECLIAKDPQCKSIVEHMALDMVPDHELGHLNLQSLHWRALQIAERIVTGVQNGGWPPVSEWGRLELVLNAMSTKAPISGEDVAPVHSGWSVDMLLLKIAEATVAAQGVVLRESEVRCANWAEVRLARPEMPMQPLARGPLCSRNDAVLHRDSLIREWLSGAAATDIPGTDEAHRRLDAATGTHSTDEPAKQSPPMSKLAEVAESLVHDGEEGHKKRQRQIKRGQTQRRTGPHHSIRNGLELRELITKAVRELRTAANDPEADPSTQDVVDAINDMDEKDHWYTTRRLMDRMNNWREVWDPDRRWPKGFIPCWLRVVASKSLVAAGDEVADLEAMSN
jgi:hypothetical protein